MITLDNKNSKIFWVALDAAQHIVTCKFPITSLQCQHIMINDMLFHSEVIRRQVGKLLKIRSEISCFLALNF